MNAYTPRLSFSLTFTLLTICIIPQVKDLSCYSFQREFVVIAFFVQLINVPRCVIDRPYIPLFKTVRALLTREEIKLKVTTLSVHF